MSALKLSNTSVSGGTWRGVLTGITGDVAPEINVTLNDRTVGTLQPEKMPDGSQWAVAFEFEGAHLSDGVQTYLFTAGDDPRVLASYAILSGDAASDDLRAELDLLRAELDLLKRAFRRHCVETR